MSDRLSDYSNSICNNIMKIILLLIVCLSLYALMVWFSTKGEEDSKFAYKVLLKTSLITLCVLWPAIYIDMFWALFVTVFLLVVATYLGSQKGPFGRLAKNGVFGGVWLTIPLYVYLLQNTIQV